MVAALFALFVDGEEDDFRGGVHAVPFHGESAEALAGEIFRGVEAVDPLVLGKVGVESEAEEAVFLAVEDFEGGGGEGCAAAGFEDF